MNAARAPEVAARRSWAYRLLRRCSQPPPIFGSREWLELPEGTPEKIGAVVVAAECWAQGQDNLVDDLRCDLDARRRIDKELDDADYQARAKAHRIEWSQLPTGKTFSERRAEQLESVKPRPGDFQGRGSA